MLVVQVAPLVRPCGRQVIPVGVAGRGSGYGAKADGKQAVAQAAVDFILPKLDDKSIVGVGTGSTANCFIDALAQHKGAFDGAVASSEATAARLKGHGIPVYELNTVSDLEFYVDGADESDENLNLIKGGGAALTREKIVAAVAKTFICIADASKLERNASFFASSTLIILAGILTVLGASERAVSLLADMVPAAYHAGVALR